MEIIDYDRLSDIAAAERERFLAGVPFAHIVLDDFLTDEAAEALLEEFDNSEKWSITTTLTNEKWVFTDFNEFGERTQLIIRELSSERFLAFLEQLSEFENLLADPDLDGGICTKYCRRLPERPCRLPVPHDTEKLPQTQPAPLSKQGLA